MLNSSSEKQEFAATRQEVIQSILKLISISEHSLNWRLKRRGVESELWPQRLWKPLDAPTCEEGILIKWSKLILPGQGGSKKRWVDFQRSLAKDIVPSDGTQPSARLQRDGTLPCKVVITSTYALPCILGGSYGEISQNSQHSMID